MTGKFCEILCYFAVERWVVVVVVEKEDHIGSELGPWELFDFFSFFL